MSNLPRRFASNIAQVWPWALIWCGALVVRLIFLAQVQDSDVATILIGDAQVYDAWGQRIAAGAWLGDKVFYQAPLYPYFLGIIYAIGGHHLLLVRVVQLVIGASSCVIMGHAVTGFFSRRAGLVAGALMALCPVVIFFDFLIQKAVLDVFCFALVWLFAARAAGDADRRRWWIALGVAFGLLALTRENALALLPLLLVWGWQHARLRGALLILAAAATVLVPVAVRNGVIGGEYHLTTSQMGPNFYIGNNPQANGTYVPLRPRRGDATFEQTDAIELAEQASGRKLTPSEVSDYWMGKSLEFIRTEPVQWLRLMARKTFLVWNADEMGDTEEQGAYAQHSPLLRWLAVVLHFGVLGPIAAAGMVWSWPNRKSQWLLVAAALTYAASVVAFYVFARYRLPLFPIAIAFASAAVVELPKRLRSPLTRGTIGGALVAIAAAVFMNWPVSNRGPEGAVTWQNLGLHFAKVKQPERAMDYFDRVLAVAPESAEALAGKGHALGELQRYDEAADYLQRALRLSPDYGEAENNLGNAILGQGKAAEAIPHFHKALLLKPGAAEAYYNKGNALARLGRAEESLECFKEAIKIDPAFADAHNNLGALLFQLNQIEPALEHFRAYSDLRPDAAGAHANLGVALRMVGRTREAKEQYEKALAIDKNQTAALGNLAWLLATSPDSTLRDGKEAVALAMQADAATQHGSAGVLRILAAAHAENGSFTDAVSTAERAIELATAQGDAQMVMALRHEIENYRKATAFRDDH